MGNRCTAKAKSSGERCKKWANNGWNVCRFHGAGSKSKPGGRPIEHGRYAEAFKGKLKDKFIAANQDPYPLDLLPELAVQRTLLNDYVGRFEAGMILTGKDLRIISDLTNDVVGTAAKIINARNQTALTVAEVKYLQMGIMALLNEFIPDTNQRRTFISRLITIIPGAAVTSGAGGDNLELPNISE